MTQSGVHGECQESALTIELSKQGHFMKLQTAIKHIHEIHRRVTEVQGRLETPLHSHDAVIFEEIWVFGSAIKGSAEPNDLDILIKMKMDGPYRSPREGAILDERYARRTGCKMSICSDSAARKWLTRGMMKVSRHGFERERNLGIDAMKMIYPRFELDLPAVTQAQVLARACA
jgi:predicted nucleotidyltransferase